MNRSLQLLQGRARARLSSLIESVDGHPSTMERSRSRDTPLGNLLTPHQQWLFNERVDFHASIDLKRPEDQARMLDWWVHQMPREYDPPDETIDWDHLAAPCGVNGGAFATLITNLMLKSYLLKKRLREQFDLTTRYGRVAYIEWYYRKGMFIEKVDDSPYVEILIRQLSAPAAKDESQLSVNRFAAIVLRRYRGDFTALETKGIQALEERLGGVLNTRAPELLYLFYRLPDGIRPVNSKLSLKILQPPVVDGSKLAHSRSRGANLIGYAHGAFGMGEHVKMAARALASWTDRFSILDVNAYAHERQPEADILQWSARSERYDTNIFHVNADAMASALTAIGSRIGEGRYNIGYWAWELSKVPEAWRQSIDFVDEIWAPSHFIQQAFQDVTDKPVKYMPLCVDLAFDSWRRRDFFNLPDNKFLFLYYFDSYSYYQRKNPLGALRAFKRAFPNRADVGLVIKTQNARADSPEWLELLELARGDTRIYILNKVMTKGEVLSLQAECDCFVSLHRSEGFGRGPAEAMWLGKPVVVTGYSGNIDFTTAENSLLVDYELIRVKAAEYPFFKDQVWAEPDEEHAASQMRRLVDEPGLAHDLAARASALMRDEYSSKNIGKRYFDRLQEIGRL